jgi:hypothetical protein
MKALLIGGRAHGQVHYLRDDAQSVDASGSVYRSFNGQVNAPGQLMKQQHDAVFLASEISEPAALATFVAGLRPDGEMRR